jgi:hypothetical protein
MKGYEKLVDAPALGLPGGDGFVARILSASNRPEDRRAKTIFFLLWYVPLVLLGLFTPETVLRDHTWAREFVGFMAQIVPQIDRLPRLKIDVEINQFVYSVVWAVVTVLTVPQGIVFQWGASKAGAPTISFGLAIAATIMIFFGWVGIVFPDNIFFPAEEIRKNRWALLFYSFTPTRALLAPLTPILLLTIPCMVVTQLFFRAHDLWQHRRDFFA